MKYIVFKYRSLFMPVIIPAHITHSQVKIEEAKPISAGFFRLDRTGYPIVDMKMGSESLKLMPRKEDEELLLNTIINRGTNAFIDYKTINSK